MTFYILKMKDCLIDSSVIISAFSASDFNHKRAGEDLHLIGGNYNLWITEHILDEVLNILLKRGEKGDIGRILKFLDQNIWSVITLTASASRSIRDKTLKRFKNQLKTSRTIIVFKG